MRPLDLWRSTLNMPRGTNDFDRFFDDWSLPSLRDSSAAVTPRCDVSENDKVYLLKLEIPGMTKDQIKIDLHDNYLTVSGERRTEKVEKSKDDRTHRSEIQYGSFMRSFSFPVPVDGEKTEARYENGILNLSVPKKAIGGARQIPIKS